MEHHNGRTVQRGTFAGPVAGYTQPMRTLLRMLLSAGTSRFDEDRDPFLEPSSLFDPSTSIFD